MKQLPFTLSSHKEACLHIEENGSSLKSGAKVIKLFCPRFTDFCTKLVFVKLDWKKLTNDKHSSLLQKSVIYGQKSCITLDLGSISKNYF